MFHLTNHNGKVVLNKENTEVILLLSLLALFGGILIAVIISICCYCIKEERQDAKVFYYQNLQQLNNEDRSKLLRDSEEKRSTGKFNSGNTKNTQDVSSVINQSSSYGFLDIKGVE